jgi:hypothetical protein
MQNCKLCHRVIENSDDVLCETCRESVSRLECISGQQVPMRHAPCIKPSQKIPRDELQEIFERAAGVQLQAKNNSGNF